MSEEQKDSTDKKQQPAPPAPPVNKDITANDPCNRPETKMIHGNNKR